MNSYDYIFIQVQNISSAIYGMYKVNKLNYHYYFE